MVRGDAALPAAAGGRASRFGGVICVTINVKINWCGSTTVTKPNRFVGALLLFQEKGIFKVW